MTDPLGPVVITSREIYDKLVLVAEVVNGLAKGMIDQAKDLGDHETRLRALEKARWPLPALAVLVSIAALALAFFKP